MVRSILFDLVFLFCCCCCFVKDICVDFPQSLHINSYLIKEFLIEVTFLNIRAIPSFGDRTHRNLMSFSMEKDENKKINGTNKPQKKGQINLINYYRKIERQKHEYFAD